MCGVDIVPEAVADKVEVDAIAATTDATAQYVIVDGELVPVVTLRVADLTPRDFELLSKYSTPELRAQYLADHGRRFDG